MSESPRTSHNPPDECNSEFGWTFTCCHALDRRRCHELDTGVVTNITDPSTCWRVKRWALKVDEILFLCHELDMNSIEWVITNITHPSIQGGRAQNLDGVLIVAQNKFDRVNRHKHHRTLHITERHGRYFELTLASSNRRRRLRRRALKVDGVCLCHELESGSCHHHQTNPRTLGIPTISFQ